MPSYHIFDCNLKCFIHGQKLNDFSRSHEMEAKTTLLREILITKI